MKKLISMVLAIAMIVSIASVVTSAAALNKVYIKAQSVEVSPTTTTVEVPIIVQYSGNNGLLSALFSIQAKGVTLTKLTKGSVVTGQYQADLTKGIVMIVNGTDASDSIPSGSTIVTATFEVPEDSVGETFDIVIVPGSASNFCDINFYDQEGIGQNGTISVQSFNPGDVNGDGRINARDVIATVKYVINRWNLSIIDFFIDAAADVDGDNKVTAKDVILIMKMIVAIR